MLEEWRCGDGIEVLDGWTFQVYRLFTNPITDLMSLLYSSHQSQFAHSPKCLKCPTLTFIRSHVYFKNDKMHGKLFPNESGLQDFTFDTVSRPGQTFGRPLSLDHRYVSYLMD
jgi:hypothetical protein